MKKAFKIIGIILIVLWFGGNLGLYVYMKHTFSSEIEKASNYTTEKLRLQESQVDSESIYFYQYKLKLPFYVDDIINIYPFLEDEENYGSGFLINMPREFISIFKSPQVLKTEVTFWEKILFKDSSIFKITKMRYYSNFKHYNWWNLIHNINLLNYLRTLKNITTEMILPEPFKIYNIETTFLKGFLEEYSMTGNKWMFSFTFEQGDETYSITYSGVGKKRFNKFRDIITSIQPVDDIDKAYKKMEALYQHKEKSKYPEELILMSMISLKGSTTENLKELLRVMEEKNYHAITIEDVKKEIERLERK